MVESKRKPDWEAHRTINYLDNVATGIVIESDGGIGECIQIPAGRATVGTTKSEAKAVAETQGYHPSWFASETPPRTVDLPAFRIDRYPVTNREYHAFCEATGYEPRAHWGGSEPPSALLDHPVTCVTLADARAYAKWVNKRLPTEAEWEKAARGTEHRAFPWGDVFDPEACCWGRSPTGENGRTDPVTAHPSGESPYGVRDLVGNVGEWCLDGPGEGSAYIKGGAWLTTDPVNLRPAARNMSGYDRNDSPFYGFRCVEEVV